MKKLIRFSDVTARDGLQSLKKIVSPENRTFLIKTISKLNFDEIEVGSLVNPRIIPAMARSVKVYHDTYNPSKYKSYVLVGNESGIDKINKNNIKYFSLFSSPSDTFNIKNINTDVSGSFIRFKSMLDNLECRENHYIKGYISCIGECPFEGDISISKILNTINEYKRLGVNEICIADTIGSLRADKLENILTESNKIYDVNKLSLHLHTTNNFLSENTETKDNLKVAVVNGVTKFDTSLFGIGGCPAVYSKDKEKTGNLNIMHAIKYLSELGCEFQQNYKSQEWEEELYNVEEICKNIIF